MRKNPKRIRTVGGVDETKFFFSVMPLLLQAKKNKFQKSTTDTFKKFEIGLVRINFFFFFVNDDEAQSISKLNILTKKNSVSKFLKIRSQKEKNVNQKQKDK